MKNRLWTMMLVFSSFLMLTACQNSMQNPTSTNQIGQLLDIPVATVSVDSDGDGVIDEIDQCANTTENVIVDKRGCAEIVSLAGMPPMMEYRAFFIKGSSELLPQYHDELDKVADQMNKYDKATIKIEAHVSEDEVSEASTSNLQSNSLAKSRAVIIKNYLILNHKIEPSRMTTLDCGIRGSIAPSDTEEGRAMNRRVYGLVTQSDKKIYKSYKVFSNSDQCVEF